MSSLKVSTLTAFLCSSRGMIIAQELHALYKKLGLTDAEALTSRRMAALATLIGLDPDGNGKGTNAYKIKLQLLRSQIEPEPSLSIDDLMSVAFPADPEEREMQLAEIRARRQDDFAAQLGDNKKKQELLEEVEARKRKMLHDFNAKQELVRSFRSPTVHSPPPSLGLLLRVPCLSCFCCSAMF